MSKSTYLLGCALGAILLCALNLAMHRHAIETDLTLRTRRVLEGFPQIRGVHFDGRDASLTVASADAAERLLAQRLGEGTFGVRTVRIVAAIEEPPVLLASRVGDTLDLPNREIEGIHVQFDFDNTEPMVGHHDRLHRIAVLLRGHANLRVAIIGHTDAAGSDEYNTALSERRARSILEHLTALGVRTDRLSLQAKGRSEPLSRSLSQAAQQRNRRVEFQVLEGD